MSKPRVLVHQEGPVARVVLNRPEVRNAMDEVSLQELTRAFLDFKPDVRVALLSGAGPDFCAGADIAWMRRAAGYGRSRSRADARRLVALCRALDEAPFPVVGLVQGSCYGAGLGIAAACDIVLADPQARFCFSEVRLGILPAVVSTFVLPKIGLSAARRYFLTAEVFTAGVARELGLVHELVPASEFESRAGALVSRMLQNGPRAVCEAKALLARLADLPRSRRLALTVETLARVRSSREAREGLGAFLEKRPPSWSPPRP